MQCEPRDVRGALTSRGGSDRLVIHGHISDGHPRSVRHPHIRPCPPHGQCRRDAAVGIDNGAVTPSCSLAKAVRNASKSKYTPAGADGASSPPAAEERESGGGCGCGAESKPMFSMSALILACSAFTSASIPPAS